jgi:transposase
MKCGIMILVSSFEIEKSNVVPFYYMRQLVEILFGFSKDDLDILPLRVHKEETLRGYLLLMFMTLIVFVLFRKAIEGSYTVEEVLLTMRNLKCKVYESKAIIQELTKQQKDIVKKLDVIVPKKMGV